MFKFVFSNTYLTVLLFLMWCYFVFWMIIHPIKTLITVAKVLGVLLVFYIIAPLVLTFMVFCFIILVWLFILAAHSAGVDTLGYHTGFWGMFTELNSLVCGWHLFWL